MKFKLSKALILAFLVSFPIYSQSVKDVNWEKPSYEVESRGSMGSSGMTNKKIPSENSSDFTPAGDFYNSQVNLSVISFTLTKPGFVSIKIYDEKGNTIDELARSSFGKGINEVKWNSAKFQTGSYYYSVITGEYSITKKIK